jgi:hypothetical protein
MLASVTSSASQELHLPLEPFLVMLRKRGFVIKPDDYLEVLRLVRQFGTKDIDATAEWLCPVLATNPFEQSLFYTVLEEYKIRQAPVDTKGTVVKRSWLRRYWWVHLGILAIVILLFAIADPPIPLSAKAPPLNTHYQVGDTIFLEASEVFENRMEDTTETLVFWRLNDELPVKGYRTKYVVKKPGPIRIIQSLRLGNVDTMRLKDTAYSYACNFIPEFDLVAEKEEIQVKEKINIKVVPGDSMSTDLSYQWYQTGTRDTTLTGDNEIRISFDTTGIFQISCTAMPANGDSGCSVTKEIRIKVAEAPDNYSLDMRMAGNTWEPPKPKMKKMMHWLLLLPSIAGILFFDYLKRRRDKRKGIDGNKNELPYEKRLPDLKPVFEVPFEKRDTKLIADESVLKRVLNQMRQKTEGDFFQINIGETIKSITKSGGIPDLVFSPRLGVKEYLVLIDRSNPKSMMTAFYDWLSCAMCDANLQVTTVYYDADFRCYHKDFPLGINLLRCGQLYGHHTLLIAGNAYNLLDRAYPIAKPAHMDALNQWEHKAIITPVPYPDWGIKEKTIGEQIILLPADLSALEYLMPAIREKSLQTTKILKPKMALWASLQDFDFEDPAELKSYFDHDEVLFQWLCAICLYPKIRWEIIIEAGYKICALYNSPDKLNYSNLLKICRIPWVTEGTYPQRTRLNLLKELSPENEIAIRQTIIGMLNTAKTLYGDGYYFSFEQEAQQTTNEFVLFVHDSKKFAGYNESSKTFLNQWDKDQLTDAPMRRYLGPQEKEKWTTPLNLVKAQEHAGLKLEALKRAENILKKSWMEYAESIMGWGIIFYLLLLFKVLPADSKVFGRFYIQHPDKAVTIAVALHFEDSCLPKGRPIVAILAGDTEYPMTYLDSTSTGNPVYPQYGTITAKYNAIRQPGSKLMVVWDREEERAFELMQASDSLYVEAACLQKTDTVGTEDTDSTLIQDTDSLKKDEPRFTPSNLQAYFNEIWTGNIGKIAIDLNQNLMYTQLNGGAGIQRNQIVGMYKEGSKREILVIVKDKENRFQKLKIEPVKTDGYRMARCDAYFTQENSALEATTPCNRNYDYNLYYPGDREKVFIPRNGKNYVNTEIRKIKLNLDSLEQSIKRIGRQQQQYAQQQAPRGVHRLSLNVYINTYYYTNKRQQQARQKQISNGWGFTGKEIPVEWKFINFSGGPFDRDYINIYQQYIIDEPRENDPLVPPAQKPLTYNQLNRIVDIAKKEVGVTEDPPGSNKGRRVNEYLASIGLQPGLGWSAAFVYWVYRQAGAEHKLRKTGSVMQLWNGLAGNEKITLKEAMTNPSLIQPGNLFFISTGNNAGHMGIVESIKGQTIYTIEGNSNNTGGIASTGVVRGVRQLENINLGFSTFGVKEMPAMAK